VKRVIIVLVTCLFLFMSQAFAGNGNLVVDGSVGVGTTTDPVTKLQVNGEIKVGNSGLLCTSAIPGALRYNSTSNAIEYCNGSNWSALGAGQSDTTPPVTTASPLGGSYQAAQTVTLTANEPATIYYTTNGTTPTLASTVYTAPVSISANSTLMYFAKDTAGNVEAVKSQAYLIGTAPDVTPPVTTADPLGGTYPTGQSVTLTTNESATIYYTTNGTTPTVGSTVYTAPFTISGNSTLMYFAKDTAGNVEAVKSQTYLIVPAADTTPPVTTASPLGGSYPNAQTVTLTANEPATIYYTTDGTTPGVNSTVYTAPFPVLANTTVLYFAKDTAGNPEAVKTQTYVIGSATDTGSIIQDTPGTYTHMFTSNATVTLAYLKGGGANYQWDMPSGTSYVTLSGVGKAVANGGVDDQYNTIGTGTNTIGGTNVLYGAANAGGYGGTLIDGEGSGGEVVGGTFSVSVGQLLTVVVGDGSEIDGADDDFAGGDGSVSLSWH
jgi:hypothetical protein